MPPATYAVSPGYSSELGTLESHRPAIKGWCLTIGGGQRLAVAWIESVHCWKHHVRQQRLLIQPGCQGQPTGTLHIVRRWVFQLAQQALVGSICSTLTFIKQSEYGHHLCADVAPYGFCNSTENDLRQQPLELLAWGLSGAIRTPVHWAWPRQTLLSLTLPCTPGLSWPSPHSLRQLQIRVSLGSRKHVTLQNLSIRLTCLEMRGAASHTKRLN